MGNFQLAAVVADQVEVGRLEQLRVAEPEWRDLESCGHCFDPLQHWDIEIGVAEKRFLLAGHHNQRMFAAAKQVLLADFVPLVVARIVVGNSYCKRYVAGDPRCSMMRIRLVPMRKLQIVIVAGLEIVGFDSLRMDFESMELAG